MLDGAQQLYAGDAARLHQFETEIIAAVRIEGLAGLQIGDDADDGLPRSEREGQVSIDRDRDLNAIQSGT